MEEVVEISYKGNAQKISVKGSWDQWKEYYPLEQIQDHLFSTHITIPYGLHQFKYLVDDQWKLQNDSTNIIPNDVGNFNQILYVGGDYRQRVSFDWEGENKTVSIVIQPAWDKPIEMNHRDGLYYLFIDLPLGIYEYKFIVDGNWVLNPNKPSKMNKEGITNNYIEILPGKSIDHVFVSENIWIRYMLYLPPEYPSQFFNDKFIDFPIILFFYIHLHILGDL